MRVSARQLNRATLDRQLLLRRHRSSVVDAVRRVVAVQAQEPASPYVALWNRVADFDPVDLDVAFAEHTLRKATLMRITLHVVEAGDHPVFQQAMLGTLRASRLNDRRFAACGLSIAEADALVEHLVGFASERRTKQDVEALFAERLGAPPHPGIWWALRTFAPLVHAPTGGPWSFGARPSFLAASRDPACSDPEASLQRLIWRYLEGFGPASAEDVAQFAMQKRSVVRQALAGIDGLVALEGPDGKTLYDVPDASLPPEETAAPPRLLAMWDSILLAYADRSRILPAEFRGLVIRRNGDVLPTLLVDGYVAGVWRRVDDGIEALAFHPLSDLAWDGLADEAGGLLALLAAREPTSYARYTHWWSGLCGAEVHLLPG